MTDYTARYSKLNRSQAMNIGQGTYYDPNYRCRKGHKFWRYNSNHRCRQCCKTIDRERYYKANYGDKCAARQKLDDALFEKKMQKMIDQDYLD